MEEKSAIKRILIAVIVVLIGAVCIAGFLALKHSHGGSWDVLLVFGIKCTSMSSFWRYINWSHDFSYYRYCRSYCTGGGSFLESCWICGQSGEKITIMLWGKILFVILSLLQASFQTMIKLDNF